MKTYEKILVFILLTYSAISFSQERPEKLLDQYGQPRTYKVEVPGSKCNYIFKIDSSTIFCEPFNFIANQPLTNISYLEGTQTIRLTTLVPKDSIQYYRYTVLLDEKEFIKSNEIPEKIDFIWPDLSDNPGMVTLNLGTYKISNKKLKVELYKTTERDKGITGIFYNKPILPANIHEVYQYTIDKNRFQLDTLQLKDNANVRLNESAGGILLSIEKNEAYFLYHVFIKNLATGKSLLVSNNWATIESTENPYLLIDESFFEEDGRYNITIVPILSAGFKAKTLKEKASIISLKISRPLYLSNSETALIIISIMVLFAIILALIKKRTRKKILSESRQKETAQLQLSMVRLHLNPHFIFNSLAGIQNFINKNDIDNANRFITRFARLTRNVLSNQELISLEDEKLLLGDYLEMEKTRFNFTYEIVIQSNLDPVNIQIPSMLLQPLVENAVKHGVSHLKNTGKIVILIEKDQKSLVITLEDNGDGFDTSQQSVGLGVNLTRKRISLLNNIYKESPASIDIKSNLLGTVIKITLSNWL